MRTGRRLGPRRRQRRLRLHAHDRRLDPRRRHLPAHRRPVSRPEGIPEGFDARRAGTDPGLAQRQCRARKRTGLRRRRRQGHLYLRTADHPLLHRRGSDSAERAVVSLRRQRRARLRDRQHRVDGREAGQRVGRLRDVDRPEVDPVRAQKIHPPDPRESAQLHGAADVDAIERADARRQSRRAAPPGSAAVHPVRRRDVRHDRAASRASQCAKARPSSIRRKAAAARTPGSSTSHEAAHAVEDRGAYLLVGSLPRTGREHGPTGQRQRQPAHRSAAADSARVDVADRHHGQSNPLQRIVRNA